MAAADPTDYGDLNVPASNRWEVVLTIDASGALPGSPPLTDGSYTIEALAPVAATANTPATSGLRDKAGNCPGTHGLRSQRPELHPRFHGRYVEGGDRRDRFDDLNGNESERPMGLAGWTVFADLPDATHPYGNGVLDTGEISATTAADGSYKLVGLLAGVTYYIREVLQSNWKEVTPAPPVNFYSVPVANSNPDYRRSTSSTSMPTRAAGGDGELASDRTTPTARRRP